ncbi:hypothetical protein [Methylobacterium mesophilicum]|uniref:hypothetical protein n=1 Tax=Methylobacterium mesophilicum TaxID=39956 RepID=UPI002F309593
MTVATFAAVGVAIIPQVEARRAQAEARERRAQEGYLLDAAVARGLLSLLSPDDPLEAVLDRDGRAPWHFADRDLVIEIRPERGKLDLELAEPRVLASLLDRLLGPSVGTAALSAVSASRRLGRVPATPDLILPLSERAGYRGALLRDQLTVYGGRKGSEQEGGAAAKPAVAGGATSIVTIRAWLAGQIRARAETVLVDAGRRRFVILDRADLILEGGQSVPDE